MARSQVDITGKRPFNPSVLEDDPEEERAIRSMGREVRRANLAIRKRLRARRARRQAEVERIEFLEDEAERLSAEARQPGESWYEHWQRVGLPTWKRREFSHF